MQKAMFGQRLAAYIIDAVMVAIVFGLVSGLGSYINDTLVSNTNIETTPAMIIGLMLAPQIVNLVFAVAYFGGFWATTGQTPGQKVLRIKVVRTDGSKITWDVAILRYIGYIASSLFGWLGFLWALWDKDKQGWSDKLAGTYVVKVM